MITAFMLGVFVSNTFSAQIVQSTNKPLEESSNELEEISDYYWREYTGVIPSDAIPGGTDTSGAPTYIGQINPKTQAALLPATIRRGSKEAVGCFGGKPTSTDLFVKILCSRNHQKYRWIPVKNELAHLLTNCHVVIGGNEKGYVLNIGRVYHEMETVIGKIFAYHTPHRGFHIPSNDKEAHYTSYELLTYDCSISNVTLAQIY